MKNYEVEVNGVAHTFQLDADDAEKLGDKAKPVKAPLSAADPDAVSEADELRAENAALKAALAQADTSGSAANKAGAPQGNK